LYTHEFYTGKPKGILEDHRAIKSSPPVNMRSLSKEDIEKRYYSQLEISKELEKKLQKTMDSLKTAEDDRMCYKDLCNFRAFKIKELEEQLHQAKITIGDLKGKCPSEL
jgi:hypothetical protein